MLGKISSLLGTAQLKIGKAEGKGLGAFFLFLIVIAKFALLLFGIEPMADVLSELLNKKALHG